MGLCLLGLMLVGFIAASFFRYKKKQQEHRLEKEYMQSHFQQELLRTQIEIQEQTLKTISQEIHDNVGQVLSLAKLNLATIPATNNEQTKKIHDTRELVSKAIIDLRNLSRSMYGNLLSETGLQAAIANELQIVEGAGVHRTRFIISGEPFKIAVQKELVVFRMVQEAIHNIIKHAKASLISINLDYNNPRMYLCIEDNGMGFIEQEIKKNGMGLTSMQNRATLIDADLTIESHPGKGTRICLTIPNAINQS